MVINNLANFFTLIRVILAPIIFICIIEPSLHIPALLLFVFASFTDVSTDQFGEGSFDKGIYFNIPVFGNFINYSWRPLTKDPGAKLVRKNTLHDLLVRFKPIN